MIRPPKLAPALFTVVAVTMLAGPARAAITLYDKDAWSVSIGGRAQGFYSFGAGDAVAMGGNPMDKLTGEQPFGATPDGDGKFVTSRMRGGWGGCMFGLNVSNQITPRLKVTGRLSFWFTVEGDQTKGPPNDNGSLDIRQGYVKLEGPFGGVLVGRNLGLHSRAALLMESAITADEFGVGSPCSITGLGLTCGQVGYGVLQPWFNAGIVYNTPELHGFQLTVGAYDPARIEVMGTPSYGRTPLPRLETEALQHLTLSKLAVDLFVNGMWQQAGHTGGPAPGVPDLVNAYGVGYGVRLGILGLQLGFAGGYDRGGGMYIPLGDVSIDTAGRLRDVFTYWGSAIYTIGKFDVAAGAGTAITHATPVDDLDTTSSLIKSHLGINGGLLYHLGPVVLVAQYFRMRHEWQRGQHQTANVFSTGVTFNW